MSILADMGSEDLEALERLRSCRIGGRDRAGREYELRPTLIGRGEPFAIEPSDVDRPRSVGVIDFAIGTATMESTLLGCGKRVLVQVGAATFAVAGKPGSAMPMPKRPSERHGCELARLRRLGSAERFASTLADERASMGFEVGVAEAWPGDQARFRVIRPAAL